MPLFDRRRSVPRVILRDALGFIAVQARYVSASVGRPALRLLLLGYFAYCFARKASRVVIVVYAFDVGGVQGAAAVAVLQVLPGAFLAPFGSALAERVDPARALAAGYAVQAMSLAAAGVAMFSGASLWLVALLSAVAASAAAVTRPVYLATLPDVVDYPDELTLGNAASAWVDGLASVLGPLLAGLGLIWIGNAEVMLALALICLLAALVSLGLQVRRRIEESPSSLRALIAGGFAAVRHDREVANMVGIVVLQYVVVGLLDVLLVVFVVDVLGQPSASVGVLAAAIGLGATVGGLGSVLLAGRKRLAPAVLLGALVCGVPVVLLGVGPALGLAAMMMAGYGVGKSVISVSGQTLLQRTVDDTVATRVFGIQEGFIQAGTAGGAAVGPLLVLLVGPQWTLVIAGLLLPIVVAVSWPSIVRLDVRSHVPGAVFSLLRGIPFLSVLPLRTLEQLARAAVPVVVPDEQEIIRQGEPGDRYYVIESGRVEVVQDGRSARHLTEGSGFGEIALLSDVPRTATVRSLGEVHLVALERDPFLEAVTGVAPARESASATVTRHLEADEDRVEGTDG